MTTTIPEVGVHHEVPFADYLAWDAISNSGLSRLAKSPAHLRCYLDHGMEDTDALALGRAAHCAILEPDVFERRYLRDIVGDGRKKEVKEARAQLRDEHPDAEIVKPDAYDTCLLMRDAVRAQTTAAGLLDGNGSCELSLAWDDADSGVRCKARLDRLSPDLPGGVIVDLKTTTDASRDAFERSIFTYGYHRQAAMYLQAAKALGIDAQHFVIIAVEKTAPYAVATYRLTEGAIEAGADELRGLLRRYAACCERDEWPGYVDEVQDIALPTWAWAKAAEQAEKARAA